MIAVCFRIMAVTLAVGSITALTTTAAAAAPPSVTLVAKQDPTTKTYTFSGVVNPGTPAWLASATTFTYIVPLPSGAAGPPVAGQVNVTQTAWTTPAPGTTLAAGMYSATVSLEFTQAGQAPQTQTATIQFTVP